MTSTTSMLEYSSYRWAWLRRVPHAWTRSASALARSLLVMVGIIAATSIVSGAALYAIAAILCVLAFVFPAYVDAMRTDALVKLSLADPLTGVANRRALEVRLEEEIARCSRGHYSMALMMIDVDNLKDVNDSRGHRMGDAVLRAVAEAISNCTRVSDVVGRFGGDEFLVIAPQTGESDANTLAERILSEVRKISESRGNLALVGVSIGVATTSSTSASRDLLLERADRAMYEAKRRGGNCVSGSARSSLQNVLPLRPSSEH